MFAVNASSNLARHTIISVGSADMVRLPEVGEVWRFVGAGSGDIDFRILEIELDKKAWNGSVGAVRLESIKHGRITEGYQLDAWSRGMWVRIQERIGQCPLCEEGDDVLKGDYLCRKCRYGI
jgi:hypothetical protein